jgi:S1-C subfamily serine protease
MAHDAEVNPMSQQFPDPAEPLAPRVEPVPMQATYWVPPPPPPPPTHSQPHVGRWIVVAFLVAALAAGGSGVGVGWGLASAFRHPAVVTSPIAIASPTTIPNNNGTGSLDANAIAALVNPAIVDINTVTTSGQASGTGQILTPDGEVLTNNHVVDGSTSIKVVIASQPGVSYTAHVIGVAPAQDVALIQIEGVSGLPTINIAASSTVKVGDAIVAIGNALGQGGAPSVTTGNVTALNQTITASEGGGSSEQLTGMIQSDAAIQPGDSGGAIVNSSGQVVGMITAGDVQGFRSQTSTVNYSIPTDTAISYINKIRSGAASSEIVYGQVGFMGVSVRNSTAGAGAQVVTVQAGSPAESAGIAPGAVITKVGGSAIADSAALGTAIRSHKAGEKVSVTFADQRGTHTTTMTLAGVNP